MIKLNTVVYVLCIISIIINIVLGYFYYKNKEKKKKRQDNVSTIANELVKVKKEDDFVIERESDEIAINHYLNVVKTIISNYNKSRSKQVAFRTRRLLMYETIMIIPVISKYIIIDIEYDTTSKILSKKSDKDIMRALTEAYNSFSKEAPESFNDLLLCSLYLSDNK